MRDFDKLAYMSPMLAHAATHKGNISFLPVSKLCHILTDNCIVRSSLHTLTNSPVRQNKWCLTNSITGKYN
jgi:hypothetical protein